MRKILEFTIDNLDKQDVERYFNAYSSAKDEKFQEFIEEAQEIVYEKAKILVVYDCLALTEFESLGFEMEALKKVLSDSLEAYVTVSSVINEKEIFDEVEDDPIIDFFAQSWMVAMLNSLRDKLRARIGEELKEGLVLSSVWSPGQAEIPLEAQRIIFDILKPEDLGISITKHCKMMPQMSVSGIMGVCNINHEEKYNSCDLCDRREICPGYNGLTLKDKEFNRRLI